MDIDKRVKEIIDHNQCRIIIVPEVVQTQSKTSTKIQSVL